MGLRHQPASPIPTNSTSQPSDFRNFLVKNRDFPPEAECRIILLFKDNSHVIDSWMLIPLHSRLRTSEGLFNTNILTAATTDEAVAERLARHSGRVEFHYFR